ncbi:hypothetical protein Tco_1570846 [Tanacetum coccineum]
MSTHSGPSPTAPTSAVRNTVGKGKEVSQGNLNGPASDATLREYWEKDFNHWLGDKEKGMFAYSDDSRRQSAEALSKSEDSIRGHWKSRSKKQRSSVEDDEFSLRIRYFDLPKFNPRIRYFDLPKMIRMPSQVKTYDGNSLIELKKSFLENYLQQKKCIKDPIEIHNIKQRDGESTEDFVRRYKLESRNVKGAQECMKISGFLNHIISSGTGDSGSFKLGAKEVTSAMEAIGRWAEAKFQKGKQILEPAKFLPESEISFPPLGEEEGTKGPMIIEAEIGGHFIHRMYVDGGSASEILYEHCFNRIRPEIKNQMVPATAPLIGFSSEFIWPLGQISLLVKIGDEEHSTSAWMNFMIVRSSSPYNEIIRRPGVRKIQAVPSTAHGMLKFLVAGGILTLKSCKIIPIECAAVSGSEGQPSAVNQAVEERIKVAINPEYPEQTILIGSTLTEEGRNKLCDLL